MAWMMEAPMALFDETDPFGTVRKPLAQHELGQPLDALSVHELAERIALLKSEIVRLEEMLDRKEASRKAADAFFKG
jgi:uncharacterized small protein (DUF1192 family)